jgi:pimeloyl-ACP methyl ester carboxylesterase
MHDEAQILREVLRGLEVRRYVIFGHSDGASIAIIHAASGGADGLRGLVLEAPHVFTEPHGLSSIARIGESYVESGLRERLARHHGDNTEVAFWGWNRVWLNPEFASWNIEGCLTAIQVPMLIIQGTADEYGTWRQVEAIQAQSGGPVEVLAIPGGGHSPHRSHPEQVLGAAAALIRRVGADA